MLENLELVTNLSHIVQPVRSVGFNMIVKLQSNSLLYYCISACSELQTFTKQKHLKNIKDWEETFSSHPDSSWWYTVGSFNSWTSRPGAGDCLCGRHRLNAHVNEACIFMTQATIYFSTLVPEWTLALICFVKHWTLAQYDWCPQLLCWLRRESPSSILFELKPSDQLQTAMLGRSNLIKQRSPKWHKLCNLHSHMIRNVGTVCIRHIYLLEATGGRDLTDNITICIFIIYQYFCYIAG